MDVRARATKEAMKLEKDIENENSGARVYSTSLKKQYILENEELKEDDILEIMDGHNVAAFIDPYILQRLEELEREEGLRMVANDDEDDEMGEVELKPDEKEVLDAIRKKKKMFIIKHILKKSTVDSRPTVPRKFDKNKEYGLNRMGRYLSSPELDPS